MGIPALPFVHFEQKSLQKQIQLLENPTHISEHLRKRRLEQNLKQAEVAEIIGVSEDCITNWENCKNEPQIRYYSKIIQFLGYNPFPFDESTLGGRIKMYRIKHGVSQKRFGTFVGVDGSTICSWENNLTVPSNVHLKQLKELILS